MNIASLDNQINQLIDDVSNAVNIHSNDLLKSKVAFQLTKINLGLRLIKRVMKLYDLQEIIEDQMLNEDAVKNLSSRELLVMMQVNSKRLNDYYGKMDKILGSLNLRELEGSLLVLAEVAAKEAGISSNPQLESPNGDSLKSLALQALSSISSIQKNQRAEKVPVSVSNVTDVEIRETISAEDVTAANRVVSGIDRVGDIPSDSDESDNEDDDDIIELPS